MTTYQRHESGHLRRAIESLRAQTLTDFEAVVVDDGSVDGTSAYLAEVSAEDDRIKSISSKRNLGVPPLTLLKAFQKTRAEYVAWLFDDCEYHPRHLEILHSSIEANPDWGMVYGKTFAYLGGEAGFTIGKPFDREEMNAGNNFIPNIATMLRREVFDYVGWYDPHFLLRRICDWDLWNRISHHYPVGYVEDVIATEWGVGLPASLGRTVTDYSDLALRYAATERMHLLKPRELNFSFVLKEDIGIEMSIADWVEFYRLCLEYTERVMDFKRSQHYARKLMELGALDRHAELATAQGMRNVRADSTILLLARRWLHDQRNLDLTGKVIQLEGILRG